MENIGENTTLPSFEEFEKSIYNKHKKDICDADIINLLRKTVEEDIQELAVADLIKKYYFIKGIEEYNDNKVTYNNDPELENSVKEYLKSNNILCNDDSFVNKTVKVKKLNAKTNRAPKKPIKVIEKDEKGNIKKYTSLKTCLWSKFKSYNYELYRAQFAQNADKLPKESDDGIPSRAHFNKICSKYWKDISDLEKVEYVKTKKYIDWVKVSTKSL